METILNRDNFLAKFPNHILVAGRFKENKTGTREDIRHNVEKSTAENINTIKDKYDIFFTPNWDFKLEYWNQESNKKNWRSLKTIEKNNWNLYCFIADNDFGEKIWEEVWLTPTITVRTKRGYHMYFMFKNPVSYKEYKERFEEIEKKFEKLLHWDPQAKDASRILRVPWFAYWADNLWEFIPQVEEYNEEEIYSFEERENRINACYNNICLDEKDIDHLKKKTKSKTFWKVIDDVYEKIKTSVAAIDVLEDLYPRFRAVSWWWIEENWKKTRWYKWHTSLNFVNNFANDDVDSRPRWGPWHIAHTHFNSLDRLLEYFAKRWWINIDDIRKEVWSEKEITFQEIKTLPWEAEDDKPKKYWTPSEWIIVDIVKKEIRWYNPEWTDIPFIKWLITPIWKTTIDDEEKYIIKIEKLSWETYITQLPSSWTVTELRRFLQHYGLMIPDKSKFFIVLYEYIFTAKKNYHYTNKLWLQILWWKKVIVSKAWTYIDEENSVYVDISDAWEDYISIDNSEINISEFIDQLIWWYDWQISLPVFLTMLLWVNAYFFRADKMQLPQSFVFWLSQSWKTTLLNLLFKSFGITKDISALSKAFVYEKYARHYVPTHFSEYRNSWHKQSEQIEWLLRNLFDGTPIEKWRADQKTNKYESNWLYVFDGQTIFTDDAAQTRMIILMANKKYQWSLQNLEWLPNVYKFATEIFKDFDDFREFIRDARALIDNIKWRLTLIRCDTRTVTNYSYLYALLKRFWLEKYRTYLDKALTEQDWLTAQDDIQTIYQKVFNLQVISKYDVTIYRWWMIINIIEEWLRVNTNIEDLKWFVKTINANFLWANSLPNLATYVDFNYIYSHPSLHWSFFRMLSVSPFDTKDATAEEKRAVMSLYEFLKVKCPTHNMLQDISFEAKSALKNNKNKWEHSHNGINETD